MTRQTTVEKMDETMVKVTSPAARRPLERLKATGQKRALKRLWMAQRRMTSETVSAPRVVEHQQGRGQDKEEGVPADRPDIGQPQQLLHIVVGPFGVPGPHILADDGDKAGPIAVQKRAATDQKLWATPLAAIWTVPNIATIELSATFESWKRRFQCHWGRQSGKSGGAFPRQSGKTTRSRRRRTLSLPEVRISITTAANTRERSVG